MRLILLFGREVKAKLSSGPVADIRKQQRQSAMNAIMDSHWEQYLEPKDFTVTPDKLEELKEKIPKAGPKYRLGMYFDTIYGLSEFDQVNEPEDGYLSHWETETEIDDELGNFIFSNVTGDSASVICIDEAMDLLAIREQQQQLYDGGAEIQPDQILPQVDHPLERSSDSKASRHSHHSGSDGTYEGPDQTSPTPLQRPCTSQEHIYETLDDCRDNYETHMDGIYVSKGSEGSRGSTDSTAKPVTRLSDDADSFCPAKAAFRSSARRHTKPRSMSLPDPPEGFHPHHRRKLSESDFPRRKKQHCGEKIAPRSLIPSPVRGYPIPPGIPNDYTEYMAVPGTPPSPTKRHSDGRKPVRGPSLIIKHKGKTFLIPVVDNKMKEKWEKTKQAAHERSKLRGTPAPVYGSLPTRHATLNTAMISRSNSTCSNGVYQTIVPVSRRHASPPKVDAGDQTHKKRARLPSQSTVAHNVSQQVTHYGVV